MIEIFSALLTLVWSLLITLSVLRLLKRRPDRDLVLPAPFMLLLVLRAQLDDAPAYALAGMVIAVVVVLYGCWQQMRAVARWATVACGGIAVYLQLSALWLARR